MNNKFIITKYNNIKIGILFLEGKPIDIHCYEEESLLGNIYIGRVSNIVESINAAFVDISKNQSCYYSLEEYTKEKKLKIGDLLLVQVTKDEIKSKKATVSTNLSITGEYVVVNDGGEVGVSAKIKSDEKRETLRNIFINEKENYPSLGGIIRTNAIKAESDIISEETAKLLSKLSEVIETAQYRTAYTCLFKNRPQYVQDILAFSKKIETEVITDIDDVYNNCLDIDSINAKLHNDKDVTLNIIYSIDDIIKKALSKRVYLKSGGYLVIEPTEALTVIDVNSGKSIKGKDADMASLKTNLEAVGEIAKHLRVRNISGIIIVDFISMTKKSHDKEVLSALSKHLHEDTVPCKVIDMTKLGLVEITRKKIRKPIWEIFS